MHRRLGAVVIVVALAGATGAPAAAQEARDSTPASDRATRTLNQPTARLLFAGVLAGTGGLLAGGAIGAYAGESECEFCGIGGAVIGGYTGATLMIPIGVHLGNRRAGKLGLAFLASMGIAAAGVALASMADDNGVVIFVSVPIVQVITSIGIEQSTAKRSGAKP